ncbi:hypothetical protein GCM10009537_11230 [Corynebacterium riegelii]
MDGNGSRRHKANVSHSRPRNPADAQVVGLFVRVDFFGHAAVYKRNQRKPAEKRNDTPKLSTSISGPFKPSDAFWEQFYKGDVDHDTGRKAQRGSKERRSWGHA